MGEWKWETGMNLDQVKDIERIRDYGMMVVFSNWSFLKNGSALYSSISPWSNKNNTRMETAPEKSTRSSRLL